MFGTVKQTASFVMLRCILASSARPVKSGALVAKVSL